MEKPKRKNRNRNAKRKIGVEQVEHITKLVRCPPMPRVFRVALRDRNQALLQATAGATTIQSLGLVEYLARNPTYLANFYDSYKYSRILSVEVELTCTNATTNPMTVYLATLPYSDVATSGAAAAIEQPGAKSKQLSSAGGMDRSVLKKVYNCLDLVGSYGGDHWWITQAQSVSTTPVDTREPVIVYGTINPLVTNSTVHVEITLIYHIEFFDLQSVS